MTARLSSFLQGRLSGYTGGMREARGGSQSAQGRQACTHHLLGAGILSHVGQRRCSEEPADPMAKRLGYHLLSFDFYFLHFFFFLQRFSDVDHFSSLYGIHLNCVSALCFGVFGVLRHMGS